jgi:Tfp pilus assembly protein PilZ
MSDQENPSGKEPLLEKKSPCQVICYLGDDVCMGSSVHFNERGIFVMCDRPAPLDMKIKLVLQFPGIENPIELQGEVVWTNIHGPSDALTPRGMGVKFLSLDQEAVRLLTELAHQYESRENIYSCYYS